MKHFIKINILFLVFIFGFSFIKFVIFAQNTNAVSAQKSGQNMQQNISQTTSQTTEQDTPQTTTQTHSDYEGVIKKIISESKNQNG